MTKYVATPATKQMGGSTRKSQPAIEKPGRNVATAYSTLTIENVTMSDITIAEIKKLRQMAVSTSPSRFDNATVADTDQIAMEPAKSSIGTCPVGLNDAPIRANKTITDKEAMAIGTRTLVTAIRRERFIG